MAAAGETWRKVREDEVRPENKPMPRLIVCYPEHYGAQGAWWATTGISPAELEGFLAAHPGAEILGKETV